MKVVEHIERWVTHLSKIDEWIEKGTEASLKRARQHIDTLKSQMQGAINTIKAKDIPRDINHAIRWVEVKGAGSYIALLTEEGELLRTMKVSKQVIGVIDPVVEETQITVAMKKRVLKIAELDLERVIPKKASKFEWIFNDGKGKITRG